VPAGVSRRCVFLADVGVDHRVLLAVLGLGSLRSSLLRLILALQLGGQRRIVQPIPRPTQPLLRRLMRHLTLQELPLNLDRLP
jgi:hypothetical protein